MLFRTSGFAKKNASLLAYILNVIFFLKLCGYSTILLISKTMFQQNFSKYFLGTYIHTICISDSYYF